MVNPEECPSEETYGPNPGGAQAGVLEAQNPGCKDLETTAGHSLIPRCCCWGGPTLLLVHASLLPLLKVSVE